jgi:polar amino acid transport system substrate-binding protein
MRRRAAACVLLAGLAVAAACGRGDDRTTLERLQQEGVVRVGYANEAPFAFRDVATGRVTGEAPEIARVVFGEMQVPRIEGVLTEFGSLIPGLQAGRFDVIAAGMYVTPARCRQVAFSEPSYSVGEAFVVAAGNPLDLHGYEGLRDAAGATLGVVTGTIERTYARAVGIADDRVVTFPDAPSALAGVSAGRVDAYAGTALTVQNLIDKAPAGVERARPFTDPVVDGRPVRGYGAFAFRPDDRALVAAFNQHLATFIGTPAHLALVTPFGFTEAERPGDVTTRALCGAAAPSPH